MRALNQNLTICLNLNLPTCIMPDLQTPLLLTFIMETKTVHCLMLKDQIYFLKTVLLKVIVQFRVP